MSSQRPRGFPLTVPDAGGAAAPDSKRPQGERIVPEPEQTDPSRSSPARFVDAAIHEATVRWTTPTNRHPMVGQRILDRFRIVRVLSWKKRAQVYLACRDDTADVAGPLVVKQVSSSPSVEGRSLFMRQGSALSTLRHSGIVGILDFAWTDNNATLVFDYVHGYTLAQLIRFAYRDADQVPVSVALYAIVRLLEALEYAHNLRDALGQPLGILHLGIKPSNVLVSLQGEVKLTNFQVAQTADQTHLSADGAPSADGAVHAASGLLHTGAPSPGSDVYAVALTAYELLTGQKPLFARGSTASVQYVSDLRRDVSIRISTIISNAMSHRSDLRYQSAGQMAAALRAAQPLDAQTAATFRTTIYRVFTSPRFAEVNQTDSLADRQRAWSSLAPTHTWTLMPNLSTAPTKVINDALSLPELPPPVIDVGRILASAHTALDAARAVTRAILVVACGELATAVTGACKILVPAPPQRASAAPAHKMPGRFRTAVRILLPGTGVAIVGFAVGVIAGGVLARLLGLVT